VLVRSITTHSLDTPHTGSMGYDKDAPKIPAASITVEDAELVDRLASKGAVQIRLRLESQMLPDAPSANVIGELRGHERPDEIVVIGAHLDSWDVGQGAHDDGAGVVAMMQALATLKRLNLTPRRTIRVVLFTHEENGLRGAKAYAKDHEAELANHVAALEADMGGFAPTGFGISHQDPDAAARGRDRLADIAMLLHSLGATKVNLGGGGADISPMKSAGVPQISLDVDNRTYFDYHHTTADTLDKVKPQDLADMAAAAAVFAYVVADLPERLDAPSSSTPSSSSSSPVAAPLLPVAAPLLPLAPAPNKKPPLPL
jgi:Zn-dependent M28 family amino/carboxypeptidase